MEVQQRSKRFALEGTRWTKPSLSYTIYKYPANPDTLKELSRRDIDAVIKAAMGMWSGVAAVDFRREDHGEVDVRIGWEIGDHGDQDSFDGLCEGCLSGDVVAHAEYPGWKKGHLHFDDANVFGRKNAKRSNVTPEVEDLFEVATHELGHILGLGHSEVKQSFMWPNVHQDWRRRHQLSEDDITAVLELYGARENPYRGRLHRSVCDVEHFDAVYVAQEGSLRLIKGSKDWYQDNNYGYNDARQIGVDVWKGSVIPTHIDAATEYLHSGHWVVYLFKDDIVYEIKSDTWKITTGYPKKFSETFQFRNFPSKIDGAFHLNGEIYFVKNSTFGLGYDYSPVLSLPLPLPALPPYDDVIFTDNTLYFIKGGFAHFYSDQRSGQPLKFSTVQDILTASSFKPGKLNMKTDWLGCEQVP